MHGIVKEYDTVMVPRGEQYRAWHHLEKPSESESGLITPLEAEANGLFPNVRRAKITAHVDGKHVEMDSHRGLVAETRDGELVPLHVASNKYAIIQNRTIANILSKALKESGVPYKFSAMGTLKKLSHFFVSVEVGEDGGKFKVNGEDHIFYLNALTNHCGSSFLTHGSGTRVVCMNTFDASRYGDKKYLDFKIVHKGDIEAKCQNLSESIKNMLASRVQYVEDMEFLASQKVTATDVAPIVSGYFIKEAGPVDKFSSRTLNMIQGITDLAFNGRGNRGETMYDVFNGGTEYWTSGDGVGRKTSASNKAFSSEFGTAAAHKRKFADYLLNDNAQYIERGMDALTATLSS